MNIHCRRLLVGLIGVALSAAGQGHPHFSRSELRRLMRDANTADQCRTLAAWFREEEAIARAKAESTARDYERYRARMTPAKFPTPADTARQLGSYYIYRADQMAALAARFEQSWRDPPTLPAKTAAPALSPNERMLLERIERLEQQLAPVPGVHNTK